MVLEDWVVLEVCYRVVPVLDSQVECSMQIPHRCLDPQVDRCLILLRCLGSQVARLRYRCCLGCRQFHRFRCYLRPTD